MEDRGKGVRDLDLRCDSLPAQYSLGVFWDLKNDRFTFVPVLLEGRLLLHKLVVMSKSTNNDKPLGWDSGNVGASH